MKQYADDTTLNIVEDNLNIIFNTMSSSYDFHKFTSKLPIYQNSKQFFDENNWTKNFCTARFCRLQYIPFISARINCGLL